MEIEEYHEPEPDRRSIEWVEWRAHKALWYLGLTDESAASLERDADKAEDGYKSTVDALLIDQLAVKCSVEIKKAIAQKSSS